MLRCQPWQKQINIPKKVSTKDKKIGKSRRCLFWNRKKDHLTCTTRQEEPTCGHLTTDICMAYKFTTNDTACTFLLTCNGITYKRVSYRKA